MKASRQAIDLIKRFEGFSSKAYLCPAGKWTIGYGTVVKEGHPNVSEKQAEDMLMDRICDIEEDLSFMLILSQNQFDALVSFIYNVGMGAFKKSTMLKKIRAGEPADMEFERWVYANGRVLEGLKARRKAEKDLWTRLY